jgi:hypothetical protein
VRHVRASRGEERLPQRNYMGRCRAAAQGRQRLTQRLCDHRQLAAAFQPLRCVRRAQAVDQQRDGRQALLHGASAELGCALSTLRGGDCAQGPCKELRLCHKLSLLLWPRGGGPRAQQLRQQTCSASFNAPRCLSLRGLTAARLARVALPVASHQYRVRLHSCREAEAEQGEGNWSSSCI